MNERQITINGCSLYYLENTAGTKKDIILLHGARLVFLKNAPHPCYLEQTDPWHRILVGFLDEQGV